ncbi:MAG: PilZ domain-containing protein [Nitrospira sp.]|nr:PilZ domain-containing protein [Nitrospira sp.]
MIERRSSKRVAQTLPIAFSNSGNEYRGVSSDFSSTGLFIITREPFSPGTRIKINLEVSNRKTIRLAGVVARTIKTGDVNIRDGMGIKLNEVPYIYHKFLESM